LKIPDHLNPFACPFYSQVLKERCPQGFAQLDFPATGYAQKYLTNEPLSMDYTLRFQAETRQTINVNCSIYNKRENLKNANFELSKF
jgi:hypothetical protein